MWTIKSRGDNSHYNRRVAQVLQFTNSVETGKNSVDKQRNVLISSTGVRCLIVYQGTQNSINRTAQKHKFQQ